MTDLVVFHSGSNRSRTWPIASLPPTDDPQVGQQFHISGVDYGAHLPECIWREGDFVIIRERGSTAWSARGETSYYPTEYHLCEIDRKGKEKLPLGGMGFRPWIKHASSEPGHKWRKAIEKMKTHARELMQ